MSMTAIVSVSFLCVKSGGSLDEKFRWRQIVFLRIHCERLVRYDYRDDVPL